MKILYVEISWGGHRKKYLEQLSSVNAENIILCPSIDDGIQNKQFVSEIQMHAKDTLGRYKLWINEISQIAKKENVDVVHFLCGDVLYRFFGMYLSRIEKPIVVTFHRMPFSFIREVSINRIFKKIDFGFVHTELIENHLRKMKIKNVSNLQYPCFFPSVNISQSDAKKKIGVPLDKKLITVFGAASKAKGTDLLIDALSKVSQPFYLYITRAGEDVNLDYIDEHTKNYSDCVKFRAGMLPDEDYMLALAATDIVVLPYRKGFDAASGPMMEAVWNHKYVVGSEHGTLGNAIREHELGRTFVTEDTDDLARVLDEVLASDLKISDKAENFRREIDPDVFTERNIEIYRSVLDINCH
ncbi:MAG: glycosyltransferase family 4 protein [Ruminococcus sp.]|nr:glycosyltransferase family 4 protein [Ruminococcus sp.]